jgi:hypothetical protein
MTKLRFLPYICDEFPESEGWVEMEFANVSEASAFLAQRGGKIDGILVIHDGRADE